MDAEGGSSEQAEIRRPSGCSHAPAPGSPELPPGPDVPPTRQTARWAMRQLTFLQESARSYGSVFTLRLLGEDPFVVVGDPALARQVFSAPEEALSAAEGNRPVLSALLGEGSLFLLGGERHLQHRRILLPPFHGPRLRHQAQTMRAIAEARLEEWPLGDRFATLPLMRELALEVVAAALFGADQGPDRARMLETLSALRLPMNARDGARPSFRRAVQQAEALVEATIRERRDDPAAGEHDDVLALLLEARDDSGLPLPDHEIRDELITLVAAGMETTAGSLSWALERLARSPDALARAIEEAEAGGGPYIEAVINETLRMRPVVPMTTRLAKRPLELDRHHIPAGVRVFVSAFLIHYDPDIYREPMVFRPERFLAEAPGTYTWIPFGGGIRRCIGAGFALQEMRIVLSALLARATPQAPDLAPEAVRNRAIVSVPARQGEIALRPRRDSRPTAASAGGR